MAENPIRCCTVYTFIVAEYTSAVVLYILYSLYCIYIFTVAEYTIAAVQYNTLPFIVEENTFRCYNVYVYIVAKIVFAAVNTKLM